MQASILRVKWGKDSIGGLNEWYYLGNRAIIRLERIEFIKKESFLPVCLVFILNIKKFIYPRIRNYR